MTKALKINDMVKRFSGFKLGPLNLELEPGTVLGLVGPNGSGKTTTLHCLVGLLRPESGAIEIFGQPNDPQRPAWKHDIGYVGDAYPFFDCWTGERNLSFLRQFYPKWSESNAHELAKRFELPLAKKVKTLSKGNRVKLALVAALAHSPRLLLFDEPTSGLDPVVRAEVLDVLFEAIESGERAIFYSTHILSDISRLADELVFLDSGRLSHRTSKEDLMDQWRRVSFRLSGNNVELEAAVSHRHDGDDHQVISSDHRATIKQLESLGAEGVDSLRMSIDEIAVHILKQVKRSSTIN